jgi:stage III sporulation protein AC
VPYKLYFAKLNFIHIYSLQHQYKGGNALEGVDLIFKVAAIGIIVAVLNQLLVRSGREDQAMLTTLAGLIVVLLMIIEQISYLFETVKRLFNL